MKYDVKNILKYLVTILSYVGLGIIGVYSHTLFILFPILAAPMCIWMMMNKTDVKRDVMINIGIMLLIYAITRNIGETLLYMVNVTIPATIMSILYRKKTPVPSIVMYTGVSTIGALFIYVIGMSYLGVDYIASYMQVLQVSKTIQMEALDNIVKTLPEQNIEKVKILKEAVNMYMYLLEYIYPSIIMLMGVWLAVIQVGIISIAGKIKKWQLPSIKQLFHFKVSKVAVVVLILCMILGEVSQNMGNIEMTVALNISLFLQNIFQLVGIITMIILIRRSKTNRGLKVVGIIISIVLFHLSPALVMLFGCFDSIFNYRKVEITV